MAPKVVDAATAPTLAAAGRTLLQPAAAARRRRRPPALLLLLPLFLLLLLVFLLFSAVEFRPGPADSPSTAVYPITGRQLLGWFDQSENDAADGESSGGWNLVRWISRLGVLGGAGATPAPLTAAAPARPMGRGKPTASWRGRVHDSTAEGAHDADGNGSVSGEMPLPPHGQSTTPPPPTVAPTNAAEVLRLVLI